MAQFRRLRACSGLQMYSKYQMLSFEMSSCCSCDVFTQCFAVKRVKCSATVPLFCSNYQNSSILSPGFLSQRFNNLQIKGTLTCFCACAATWFLLSRTVFQDWRLVKKSSSIDPETPEKAIISVFKSYLVHLGSFKRHILYFCASIVEKIRSHWGEPYEAKFVVVSVPTNGSNVAFNVVIWLSFLSIKVLQSTIYLWRIFFKRYICKES